MSPANPNRLPTRAEARSLANAFERHRQAAQQPGEKLRYALARNAMMALVHGTLERPTRGPADIDLVAEADRLFGQVAAGEIKGRAAAEAWERLRGHVAVTADGDA